MKKLSSLLLVAACTFSLVHSNEVQTNQAVEDTDLTHELSQLRSSGIREKSRVLSAPYFTLPTLDRSIKTTAFSFGTCAFVSAGKKPKLFVVDALRAKGEEVKFSTGWKNVAKHTKKDYAGKSETPVAYNDGYGSTTQNVVAKMLFVPKSAESFAGTTLLALYQTSTPMWIEADSAEKLHETMVHLHESARKAAINPFMKEESLKPLTVITVKGDQFLETIAPETWDIVRSYCNVTTFADTEVREFFQNMTMSRADLENREMAKVEVPFGQEFYDKVVMSSTSKFSLKTVAIDSGKSIADIFAKAANGDFAKISGTDYVKAGVLAIPAVLLLAYAHNKLGAKTGFYAKDHLLNAFKKISKMSKFDSAPTKEASAAA